MAARTTEVLAINIVSFSVPEGRKMRLELKTWLQETGLAPAIVWEPPDQHPKAFPCWSKQDQDSLEATVNQVLCGLGTNLVTRPELAIVPPLCTCDAVRTTFKTDHAWICFKAHISQSLAIEYGRWVDWSIQGLPTDQLALLFDSRSLFSWNRRDYCYEIPLNLGAVTPSDPVRTFQFLTENEILQSDRMATISELLDWSRSHLVHFTGDLEAGNVYQQWQYYGFPPVESIIQRTPHHGDPESGLQHRTAGCWGTTGFLRAVLRTANIPVRLESPDSEHALPHFVRERRFLSHGDDPYNKSTHAIPTIPARELLIGRRKFNAWFGPKLLNSVAFRNRGRQPRELSIRYLSENLLRYHCQDVEAGRNHAQSKVLRKLRDYTLEELEKMKIWNRIERKIKSRGGCEKVLLNSL